MTMRQLSLITTLSVMLAVSTAAFAGEKPTLDELKAEVVAALDGLAAEIETGWPVAPDSLPARLRAYLDAHGAFYGAAVAVLGDDGKAVASPYVYRAGGGYKTLDLATPSYGLETQGWFTRPLVAKAGTWTEPYFDEGGGGVWMITRSVPVLRGNRVRAIVTTDLRTEQ